MSGLPKKYLVIIILFVLAAVTEVGVMFALKNSSIKFSSILNPQNTIKPTPAPLSLSNNLPYDAQDPTLIQASAIYVFQGTVTNIGRDQDNNLLVTIKKTANSTPNLTPIKIPVDTETIFTTERTTNTGSEKQQTDASVMKVADNVTISVSYDLRTKKIIIPQLLITR